MSITFTIPLYIPLIAYFVFLLIVAIFVAVHIYHIIISASFHLPSFFIVLFIFGSQSFILYLTWTLLRGVNWLMPLITITIPFQRLSF